MWCPPRRDPSGSPRHRHRRRRGRAWGAVRLPPRTRTPRRAPRGLLASHRQHLSLPRYPGMSRSRAWYRDVGRALPAPDAAHSARPALLEPPADTVRPWAVGNWPARPPDGWTLARGERALSRPAQQLDPVPPAHLRTPSPLSPVPRPGVSRQSRAGRAVSEGINWPRPVT